MERYTADDIRHVSIVFDDEEVADSDDPEMVTDSAQLVIEHETPDGEDAVVDVIRVGDSGASILHNMATTEQFDVDLREVPSA